MGKTEKAPMTAAELQPTWEYLVRTERTLRRNKPLCRVVQPVGTLLFLFHLLLVTANLVRFYGGEAVQAEFARLPLLPALTEALPRGSQTGTLVFSVLFAYLPPLAVCAAIAGIFYALHRGGKTPIAPLGGSEIAQARALSYKAEAVYELRKEIRFMSPYTASGILTALTAFPIVSVLLHLAEGAEPAVLEIALGCFALLLCLFVLFWVYTLLFYLFSLLNALFFLCPGAWKLYRLYWRVDAYWESVDPAEFAKRQRRREAAQAKKSRFRRKSPDAQALPEEEPMP